MRKKKTNDIINYRYPGSGPFQDKESDRLLFKGRDKEITSLLNLILSEKLTIIFAKSGIGKSSILNAGVAELLREQDYFPIFLRLNQPDETIQDLLCKEIQQNLDQHFIESVEIYQWIDQKKTKGDGDFPSTLWEYFKINEFWSDQDVLLRPILIFDQFEEIFTLYSEESRQDFTEQLANLVRDTIPKNLREPLRDQNRLAFGEAPVNVKIVIAIREDFIANLDEMSQAIPSILHNRFRLTALSRENAQKAIVEPAKLKGEQFDTRAFTYKTETIDDMLDFLCQRREGNKVIESNEIEPFQLQILCRYIENKFYQEQNNQDISSTRIVEIDDLGNKSGIQGVFHEFYNEQISKLGSRKKIRSVRKLCEKGLINIEGRRLSLEEGEIERQYKVPTDTLSDLVGSRLLRSETRVGSKYYEISHDTLVEPIKIAANKRKRHKLYFSAIGVCLLILPVAFMLYKINENRLRQEQHMKLLNLIIDRYSNKDIIKEKIDKIQSNLTNYELQGVSAQCNALIKLGGFYFDKRIYQEAKRQYEHALELPCNDRHIDAYIGLGFTYSNQEKFNEAFGQYERAMKHNPSEEQKHAIYIDRGSIYSNPRYEKYNYDRAISEYDAAKHIGPDDPQVYIGKGIVLAQKKEFDEAIKNYQEALSVDPKNPYTYSNIAHALFQKDDLEKSILYYEVALLYNSTNSATIHNNLGLVHQKKGDYVNSLDNFTKAIELSEDGNPSRSIFFNNRGFSFLKMQKYNKAESDFKKSQALGSKNGWLYRNWACYYLKYEKDKPKAIKYLEIATQVEYPYKDYNDFRSETCFDSIRNDEQVPSPFQSSEG